MPGAASIPRLVHSVDGILGIILVSTVMRQRPYVWDLRPEFPMARNRRDYTG